MAAYYNEIEPFAAQWLRNLIQAGLIADGEVDERSIVDVSGSDLRGFTQCHFFAGIGVWSYALRKSGWSDDREVWTGSCPCQPFSSAGRGGAFDDERHLWPHFFRLIKEQRPDVVFGEQVSSKDGLAWLDFVCADLEAEDYTVGALDTCAAGVGAPHIRQRLYWVADSGRGGVWGAGRKLGTEAGGAQGKVRNERVWDDGGNGGAARELGNSDEARPQGHRRLAEQHDQGGRERTQRYGAETSFWGNATWLPCRDGKARPVEPGTFPLAHGVAGRVGRLRAYGNAIVGPQAQAFIESYMECRP